MKRMEIIVRSVFMLMLMGIMVGGCRRTDVRDFTVEIPAMQESDADAIRAALANYSGVKKESYRFDMAKRTLSLRYDSMLIAKKNIEMAIASAGFTANGVTPESIGAKTRGK